MAFVLELETTSTQEYIKGYIVSIIREHGVKAVVRQRSGKIICAFASDDPGLQSCLDAIVLQLPASCFLKGSRHYEIDGEPDALPTHSVPYPLGLGLCPSCQKELFDPSSRRYYYPFTSCAHCGGQYAFLQTYPFRRSNTSFSPLRPCPSCEVEVATAGLRESHHLNSCHACGVPVRLVSKSSERYANDAGSFRTMFEVAAKAIVDEKKVLIKTTMGHRLFYRSERMQLGSILMMIDAQRISDHLSLIEAEFNALLSIERPLLHVTLKEESLKARLGDTQDVKYPDDGFTVLLAKELQRLGLEYVAYEAASEATEADILMDYDLGTTPQEDLRLFIDKETQFVAKGERVCFPARSGPKRATLSVAHGLVAIEDEKQMLFDQMARFDSVTVDRAVVLEGDEDVWHSQQRAVSQDEASFMSVIAEHHRFGRRCVGAYFDDVLSFLYYDGFKVIRVIPPKTFGTDGLLQRLASLREGSDRLIANLKQRSPEVYARLEAIQTRADATLFEVTAIILELHDESMEGVQKEALKSIGRGGVQVDTRMQDHRFDDLAFLASIISYRLAGVDSVLLSHSIFESLGDHIDEVLQELKAKTKAEEVILCGTHLANQSLFSRIMRDFRLTPPLMNINYPIGKENAVVGGVYL